MEKTNTVLGLGAAILATVFYGSCYVPVRWFEAGDGLYFQWISCVGHLLVGIIGLVILNWPPVHPAGMLGGVFFACGNALTITIMDGIGMAVGSLLWNTVTCITGWAVARYGLFGCDQKIPHNNIMNIIGIIVVCAGGCFFATLKHHPMKVRPVPWEESSERNDSMQKTEPELVSTTKRIIATVLTIPTGALYGNMTTPMCHLVGKIGFDQEIQTYSTFFFSFALGAFTMSSIIFMVYSLYRRNRPFINPELTAPSLLSGLMYGAATSLFFYTNQHLDPIVAYPILAKAPGIVCSIWAVLLFKEIKGRRDILHLMAGICVTLVGIILITVSKI
ncbi:hypothetical protein DICVIV_10207 [Dictyocaulus viviparus]|uniref:Sugar transport protein n=1 Tax=Dictyocaulus viviparus TaxID=29172 RepID=A0A0D8XGR3_DICVI|nr:hypothetical protein DICVIV_10207 [Dictyocaulus viviparus]